MDIRIIGINKNKKLGAVDGTLLFLISILFYSILFYSISLSFGFGFEVVID